ncbi:MAG TPA: glycosyltransferase, partial [Flavitalea sp.]|nr:glycosyltransferase [Flavitalea sp.]
CCPHRYLYSQKKSTDTMKPVRIVSIIPYKVLPAKLGGEKGIAVFNEYVGSLVPITAITTESNEVNEAKNYTVINSITDNRIRYINPFLYFRVRKLIRQTNASHLLIEHPYFGWLAWLIRHTLRIRWVVHSHNIEYMRSKSIGRWWWKMLMWYERWVYKSADKLFFISEDDLEHAITQLAIERKKSTAITFGIEQATLPGDIAVQRNIILKKYEIGPETCIMLFNGALYHHTNYDSVTAIVKEINPVLMQSGINYKIFICGKGLPVSFNDLKDEVDNNIIYAGFVEDISVYFKAADIFLNPIISGGGVKTKAIEALANNCTVISTEIGALGLNRAVTGDKLQVVADNDWLAFSKLVIKAVGHHTNIPDAFFDYYYWGNIAKRVVNVLENDHA